MIMIGVFYAAILLLPQITQAIESVLYDSDVEGFLNWTISYSDVSSPMNYEIISNLDPKRIIIKTHEVPKNFHFVDIKSPYGINIKPAQRIIIETNLTVDGSSSSIYNSYVFRLALGFTAETIHIPFKYRIYDRNYRIKKRVMTFPVRYKNPGAGILSEYMGTSYFRIWFGLGHLMARYPNTKNVTLSAFKISYLECPPQTHNLVKYKSSIPASTNKGRFNYQYGVCVRNAVPLDPYMLFLRTCDHEGKSHVNDRCVCKRGFWFDRTNQQCKVCGEGFYKSKKGNTQCMKCGKNSFNTPYSRFKCLCANVKSGPTYRMRADRDIDKWSADCHAYPEKVRDLKTQPVSRNSFNFTWKSPNDPGSMKPLTYIIECVDSKDCQSFPEKHGRREIQRSQNEFIILANLTSVSIRVCSHNAVSLSNLGSDIGGTPYCSDSEFIASENQCKPPKVTISKFNYTNGRLQLSWNKIENELCKFVYYLEIKNQSNTIQRGPMKRTTFTIEDLVDPTMVQLWAEYHSPYGNVVKGSKIEIPLSSSSSSKDDRLWLDLVVSGCVIFLIALVMIFVRYWKKRNTGKKLLQWKVFGSIDKRIEKCIRMNNTNQEEPTHA
ncbi:ephrin type-B receptor 3-like [Clytia hemisphaerica]